MNDLFFKSLVGSHNYNLNVESSDADFKVFLKPSFKDLYKMAEVHKNQLLTPETDIAYYDVRKLAQLLFKANVNYIECLFSQEMESNDELFDELFAMRDDISRMNLPYLYNACIGMYHQRMGKYFKNGAIKDKYQALRILDFLTRFANSDFTDFGGAIRYEESDPMRKVLLDMRNGLILDGTEFLDEKRSIVLSLNDKYGNMPINEKTLERMNGILEEVVRRSLIKELV